MLCDPDALRASLGSRLENQQLGLPHTTGQIEALLDPKAVLEAACAAAFGGRRRRQRRAPPREDLGERVDLEALRRLAAFRFFETCLRQALVDLNFLPA